MRPDVPTILNFGRRRTGDWATTDADGLMGMFQITVGGIVINIVSSGPKVTESGRGEWEHVSVSVAGFHRLPTWDEMCYVKHLFWRRDETVVQFHPREQDYQNTAEVLHLWKPAWREIELPPAIMV
jgi:hypothetical protein